MTKEEILSKQTITNFSGVEFVKPHNALIAMQEYADQETQRLKDKLGSNDNILFDEQVARIQSELAGLEEKLNSKDVSIASRDFTINELESDLKLCQSLAETQLRKWVKRNTELREQVGNFQQSYADAVFKMQEMEKLLKECLEYIPQPSLIENIATIINT